HCLAARVSALEVGVTRSVRVASAALASRRGGGRTGIAARRQKPGVHHERRALHTGCHSYWVEVASGHGFPFSISASACACNPLATPRTPQAKSGDATPLMAGG